MDRETPAALAADTGDSITIDSITSDKRFPHGFGPGVSEKVGAGLHRLRVGRFISVLDVVSGDARDSWDSS